MSEFPRDAIPNKEQAAAFRENGYALLKGFYDVARDIAPVQKGIYDVVGQVMKRHGLQDRRKPYSPASFDDGYDALIAIDRRYGGEVYDAAKQIPAFIRLIAHPANERAFGVLRPGSIPGLATGGHGIRIDNPREEKFRSHWHQEFVTQPQSLDGIVFWSSLVAVTPEMGPVQICVGSHRDGLCRYRRGARYADKQGAYQIGLAEEEETVRRYSIVAPLPQPGDLLVLDYLTLHQSGQNVAQRSRWSMQLRYFNFTEPTGMAFGWPASVTVGTDIESLFPGLLRKVTPMESTCNVCRTRLGAPIYESAENGSITTMNKLIPGRTRVFFCEACGHLQTSELPNLVEYYAHEYEVNLGSEDDDQLYKLVDGRPVYRADHQAAVLRSKVAFFPGCRVLDYGCAKAPTLRKTVAANMEIEPFLFDVTDKYIPFWKRFPKLPQWSIHQPDPAWRGGMDVVLSFYALEHVSDLGAAIGNVKALLKKGGVFYFLVPNVYANVADFIVADHINHFSRSSLHRLLELHGFDSIKVDDTAHDAAFVVKARLASTAGAQLSAALPALDNAREAVSDMASYWQNIANRIRQFEDSIGPAGVVAIYGAGFYGNLIASVLRQLDRVRCFVDQNKFLQGNAINGRQILAPDRLPGDVTHILVGLNPRIAKSTIQSLECWNGRQLEFFFL